MAEIKVARLEEPVVPKDIHNQNKKLGACAALAVALLAGGIFLIASSSNQHFYHFIKPDDIAMAGAVLVVLGASGSIMVLTQWNMDRIEREKAKYKLESEKLKAQPIPEIKQIIATNP